MIKVKFIASYRGWATDEEYYLIGAEAEFTKEIADYLRNHDYVVFVKAPVVVKKTRKPSKKVTVKASEDA